MSDNDVIPISSTTAGDGTLTVDGDTVEVRFQRFLSHPIERVWAALTESDRLNEWLAARDGLIEPVFGGRVYLPTSGPAVIESTVLEVDPPRLLVYEWRTSEWDGGPVRWELAEIEGGTRLVLTHSAPAATETPWSWTLGGWHTLLDRLAKVFVGMPQPYAQADWERNQGHYAQVHGEDRGVARGVERASGGAGMSETASNPGAGRDGKLTLDGDTAVIRFERHLRHPIAKVWEAITEPGTIEQWLAPAEVDPRPGGRFRLAFTNTDSVVDSTISELEPPRLLGYRWVSNGQDRGAVRWELTETDGGSGTRLVLTHAYPGRDEGVVEFRAGWQTHLSLLAGALAGRPRVFDWALFNGLFARYRAEAGVSEGTTT